MLSSICRATTARLFSTSTRAFNGAVAYPFSKTALTPAPPTKSTESELERLQKGKGLMMHLRNTLYSPGKAVMMQALFSRRSPTQLRVGSIVTVLNDNAPNTFTGVLISIRRRGPDSSIVLRNILQRTGIEMQFFPNAPGVKAVKVVRPPPKGRMKRAKLFYLRDSSEKMSMLAGGKRM